MRHYDLTDLELFTQVANAMSLTKGARSFHLSPSSASVRIRRLEDALGVPLLRRLARSLELTQAGGAVRRAAADVAARLDAMEAELAPLVEKRRGVIRVAANYGASIDYLPAEVQSFLVSHPQARVSLAQCDSLAAVQAVARGQADIGLSAYEGVFSGVAFLPWREDRLVVVCGAGHPLASRGSVAFRECAPYEFAGLASSSAMQRFVFERAREAGFEISPRIQIDSQSVLMSMVSTGVGIGVVSRSAFERSRTAGLAAVEIRDAWAARHLRIALPDGPRDNHPALEDFIAQLRRPPAAGGREG